MVLALLFQAESEVMSSVEFGTSKMIRTLLQGKDGLQLVLCKCLVR